MKEMRNRKDTEDDDVPGDVLKLLGEGGLKILTKLINTIYETEEWPKDFTEVTMTALKKKTRVTKCNDHRTINLIAHTAKIRAKILRRTIERKIEDVLEEDQFGFTKVMRISRQPSTVTIMIDQKQLENGPRTSQKLQ